MDKKDLLSKLVQVYDEKYQEEKPILFPSDIPRQDVEAIAREIVSTIESYDVNIDKRELEKLSKEIAEGYLFELEVDKLINKTFEEIKEKENLDEDITLDKFIEKKEGLKTFKKYLNETKEKWEKNFKLERELKDLEKAGTFIVFQAQRAIELMRKNIRLLKNPSKMEEYAINSIKSGKSLDEFILLLVKMKKEKGQPTNIQRKILAEKDFIGFTFSTLKEIDSKIEVEENEFDKAKQYADMLRHKTIAVFKNTKHLSQEAIENIEKLKQDLIKNASELDINKTLEDAIKHAAKFKAVVKASIESLKKEIEKKKEFLSNPNKKIEEKEDETIDDMSLQEISEMIKQASKEREDKVNTTDNPIEIANLYKIAHREEKLKNLDKYIEYNWIYRLKGLEIAKSKLFEILLKLMKREMIELEKRRKKKQEK
ncbi:MAG: hypothetical protein JHC31_04465 [Sulfurihydrogenibium sp.]|nr:hypothetical protein [Sulfurihydrogenibium sp.]